MSEGQRFKALLFDFDETLVPEYEASDQAVQEIAAEIERSHGLKGDLRSSLRSHAYRLIGETPMGAATEKVLGPESIRWAADELVWDDKRPMSELAEHMPEFRELVWTAALDEFGISDSTLASEMAEKLPKLTHQKRSPYQDAEHVLSMLGEKHPMAILTNGTPVIQAHKVENSGLKHHFDHVVLCDEHGSKPDPAPFRHALDLLGCGPSDVAMVGNSLRNDIAGARNAGIYAVWIDRGVRNEWDKSDVQPDATVNSLGELLKLL